MSFRVGILFACISASRSCRFYVLRGRKRDLLGVKMHNQSGFLFLVDISSTSIWLCIVLLVIWYRDGITYDIVWCVLQVVEFEQCWPAPWECVFEVGEFGRPVSRVFSFEEVRGGFSRWTDAQNQRPYLWLLISLRNISSTCVFCFYFVLVCWCIVPGIFAKYWLWFVLNFDFVWCFIQGATME